MKPKQLEIKSTKTDLRGQLTVLEGDKPFKIKRSFWITDIPSDCRRGGHAHKKLQQFIIPVSGKCVIDAYLPNGEKIRFRMVNPAVGLYVPPKVWLDIHDFSNKAVLLVFASEKYDPKDYIHSREEFEKL